MATDAAKNAAKVWEAEQIETSRGSLDARRSRSLDRGASAARADARDDARTPRDDQDDDDDHGLARRRDGITMTWRDLRYVVHPNGPSKPSKEVLRGLTGAALPRHVMALMGPTGSGKTSLLNVLSGRVPSGGTLAGDVRANGVARGPDFAQKVAYVMQEELLFPFLSVRETFELHARLRLPPSASVDKKRRTAAFLISELGLKNVADSPVGRVGGFPRGLSGGERKRCNIGVEMVRDPSAIFLDEPTSGLDSFQAQNVMSSLRDLAMHGRCVVCTIHQPRSSIYTMLDSLMLLTDGRLAYIGDARDAVGYFEKMHFKCPTLTNPADFFMDVTSIDFRSDAKEANSRERVRTFAREAEARGLGDASVKAAMASMLADADAAAREDGEGKGDTKEENETTTATTTGGASWPTQFALLLARAHKCQRRDTVGVGVTVLLDIVYALLLSALFRNVADDQEGVQNRLGCLFFIALNLAYSSALPAINLFTAEKYIVIRERASGAYTTSAYYVSKFIAELPRLLSRFVFCVLVYWIVGFNPTFARFAIFVAIVLAHCLAAQAIGMVMATGLPIGAALAFGPATITVFTLFGGIYLNVDTIPEGAGWVKFIDFIYYTFSALCVNEFDDSSMTFSCDAAARCLENGDAVLELYGFEDVRVSTQILCQLALTFGLQALAFRLLVRSTSRFLPLEMDPAVAVAAAAGGEEKNADADAKERGTRA